MYFWLKYIVIKSQGKLTLKTPKEVCHKQTKPIKIHVFKKDTSKQTSSIKIAILKMFYWSKLSKQTKDIEENEESKQGMKWRNY